MSIRTDGGELEMADQEAFPGEDDHQSTSCSMDTFFDEIFNDATHACTHTHTCNPAGPDLTHHTHTCFHVHTKILSTPTTTLSAAADQTAESADMGSAVATNGYSPTNSPSFKKRPCGNREAVRKYRQKKKAQAASLEDDNRQLREENQQLRRILQDMSALETENVKLKFLLVDLRSRIDGVLGSFPYQRTVKASMESRPQMNLAGGGAQIVSSCGVSCENQSYCALPLSKLGTGPCLGGTNTDFL